MSAAGGLVGVVAGFLLVLALKTWGSQVVQTAVGYAVFDPLTLAALTISVVLLSLAASLLATRAALRLSMPGGPAMRPWRGSPIGPREPGTAVSGDRGPGASARARVSLSLPR